MIQSGIHLAPILRQNPFELQSSDDSVDFGPPSLCFILRLVVLRANPCDRDSFWKAWGWGSILSTVPGVCLAGETASPPRGDPPSFRVVPSLTTLSPVCRAVGEELSAKASNAELQCWLLSRSWTRRWRPGSTLRSSLSCWRRSTRWAEADRAIKGWVFFFFLLFSSFRKKGRK